MSSTPSVTNPKKRELSSPEDSTETKKNRGVAQMLTTSGMATEGAVAGSGDNPVFTLSNEQLERIEGSCTPHVRAVL